MRVREAPVPVDRGFGLVAQPPDARGDARREPDEHRGGHRERRERQHQQPLERPAAHRENGVGALLDDDRACDLVAVPDRVRGRDHHGLAVGRVAQAESRPALQRAGNLAPGSERVVVDGVVEILARARDQEPEHALRESLLGPALLAPQAAGEREHAQLARHHPDARRAALDRPQNLADLLGLVFRGGFLAIDDERSVRALPGLRFAALGREPPQLFLRLAQQVVVAGRARAHQARAVVQRGRHRARGGEQGLLLAFQEKALHLAHVLVPRPGQRKEHERHQGKLGAKAQGRELHAFQR